MANREENKMTTNPRIRVYRDDAPTDSVNPNKAKFLSEKALQLRIVEEFLSQIEASTMTQPAAQFNTAELKSALRELRESGSADAIALAETMLGKWFSYLSDRDAPLEAYHIRRYCDGLRAKLPVQVFLAAARFYRSIQYSRRSLSKFDLVMTRAFSTDIGDLRRTLIADRDELAEKIASLYSEWDIPYNTFAPEAVSAAEIVARFDDFVEECVATDDFSTLTSSRLFDRIREYKAELGLQFFHPQVVAAAIGCNVAVGNRLNYLMAKASENLGERLGSEYDLAGAFHDTSPNAAAYLNEVLSNVRQEVSSDASSSTESDVDLLRTMFRLAAEVRLSPEATNEAVNEMPAESAVRLIDRTRLDPVKFPTGSAILSAIQSANAPTEGYYGDCLDAAVQLESALAELNSQNLGRRAGENILSGLERVEMLASMAEEYLIGSAGSERELLLLVWNRLLQLCLRANRIAVRSGLESLATGQTTGVQPPNEIGAEIAPTPTILLEIN